MTFSIIVPTFNEERIIGKTLGAIRHHLSNIDYELIVTDDGSTDRTCDIAERYADRVVRLTGAIDHDRGVGERRSAGAVDQRGTSDRDRKAALGGAHGHPDNSLMASRIELGDGAWLDYLPAWIASLEADRLLLVLRDELAWEQREIVMFGRRVLQPRLIAWVGAFGYRYSGQTLEPRPPEPALAALLARVVDHTRVPFNHVLANRYRDGSDSIGFHADDEPELGLDPVVATLSFGATRKFVLKPRRTRLGSNRSLDVEHGSLLVMGGTCQQHYVHGVPRQSGVSGERISLTFRHLLRPP